MPINVIGSRTNGNVLRTNARPTLIGARLPSMSGKREF